MAINLTSEKLDHFKEVVETQVSFNEAVALSALDEMKVLLTKCNYLSRNAQSLPIYDRLLFREILELGIILSVRIGSLKSIHDFYQQLKFFYFFNEDLPASERMFTIIGTYLLACFSIEDTDETIQRNLKIVDFHADLAQVQTKFSNNRNIRFILDVEQAVSDNKLNKITELQKLAPSTLFTPFMEKLVFQVKKNLATNICSQCKITIADLTSILHMETVDQCSKFIKNLGWSDVNDVIIVPVDKQEEAVQSNTKQDDVIRSAKHFTEL